MGGRKSDESGLVSLNTHAASCLEGPGPVVRRFVRSKAQCGVGHFYLTAFIESNVGRGAMGRS